MKSKEQMKAEAQDYLERKLEKLHAEIARLQNEIKQTEMLLEKVPKIYESNYRR